MGSEHYGKGVDAQLGPVGKHVQLGEEIEQNFDHDTSGTPWSFTRGWKELGRILSRSCSVGYCSSSTCAGNTGCWCDGYYKGEQVRSVMSIQRLTDILLALHRQRARTLPPSTRGCWVRLQYQRLIFSQYRRCDHARVVFMAVCRCRPCWDCCNHVQ